MSRIGVVYCIHYINHDIMYIRVISMKSMASSRMIRKQVYINKYQNEQLKRLSQHKKISEAQIIRMAVDQYIKENESAISNPLYGLIGLCKKSKSPSDVAINHDKYLGEINCERKD